MGSEATRPFESTERNGSGEADRRARGRPVSCDGPRSRYAENSDGSPVRSRRYSPQGSPRIRRLQAARQVRLVEVAERDVVPDALDPGLVLGARQDERKRRPSPGAGPGRRRRSRSRRSRSGRGATPWTSGRPDWSAARGRHPGAGRAGDRRRPGHGRPARRGRSVDPRRPPSRAAPGGAAAGPDRPPRPMAGAPARGPGRIPGIRRARPGTGGHRPERRASGPTARGGAWPRRTGRARPRAPRARPPDLPSCRSSERSGRAAHSRAGPGQAGRGRPRRRRWIACWRSAREGDAIGAGPWANRGGWDRRGSPADDTAGRARQRPERRHQEDAGSLQSGDARTRPGDPDRAGHAWPAQRHHRRRGGDRRPHDADQRRWAARRRRGAGADRRHGGLPTGYGPGRAGVRGRSPAER